MTMQMAELVAERELDALVAEKVMGIELGAVTPADIGAAVMSGMSSNRPNIGYSVMTFDWGGGDFELTYQGTKFNYGGAAGNDGYGLWFWEQRQGKDWQPFVETHVAKWRRSVREYSTDIAAAWTVAEKFEDGGIAVVRAFAVVRDSRPPIDGTGGRWQAQIWTDRSECTQYVAYADTAPLAICRAALIAVEAQTVRSSREVNQS